MESSAEKQPSVLRVMFSSRRTYICFIPLLLLAILWAMGERYLLGPEIVVDPSFILDAFKWFIIFGVIYLGVNLLLSIKKKLTGDGNRFFFMGVEGDGAVKTGLVIAAIIFVCWVPYLLALYPGSISNDTYLQLWTFYDQFIEKNGEQLTDHHPLLDTMIMGIIVRFGQLFLGSAKHGVFLYMVLQFLLMSASMAVFLCYCRSKLGLARGFCIGALCFIALFPLFPLLCCNMSKDSLFS